MQRILCVRAQARYANSVPCSAFWLISAAHCRYLAYCGRSGECDPADSQAKIAAGPLRNLRYRSLRLRKRICIGP